ncbi:fatty-acid amide hydrolase 1-like isoform X2 [Narcine bancroftii]|uniref:fatty-acid amide hydrolase 1-like isoform X2 n=1 Tax=Narcine bancroftii TaxID=1343680 RepID=UPI0038319326
MKIEVHKSVKIEIICIIFISIVLSLNLMRWLEIRNYHQTILRVRSRREESLKNMEKVMDGIKTMDTFQTKIDHEHLLTLRDLQKSIKISDVSASYILHAYMEKALEATKKFNCITDFLPECQTRLSELQDEPKGPLYGIPISIKENINCKGHDSTCGLRKFINKPIDEDCVIVQVLKIQGAIPFVKTNVPQTLFSYECSNPIYGQTINPLNPKRTPGGSSGGEAALIAAGGSILGIGTDVGGSIRLPAAFCGICGFKPTANRLSKKGLSVNSTGQRTVESSVGPLARDVDSLAYCMKALLCEDMFELDPTVPPLPFNDMLISFTPPKMFYAMNEVIFQGLLADHGASFLESLQGDIIDPHLRTQVSTYAMPGVMKKLLCFFLKPFSPRVVAGIKATGGIGSVKELWKHHIAAMAYRDEYVNAWKRQNIEVLLCPSLGPAFNIGYAGELSVASSYMVIFNLLNFPAGVVPVTHVTEEDEKELMNYTGFLNDIWDKTFKKAVAGGVDLPLAVQCVALPWQDELCLCFMKEVERLVNLKKIT